VHGADIGADGGDLVEELPCRVLDSAVAVDLTNRFGDAVDALLGGFGAVSGASDRDPRGRDRADAADGRDDDEDAAVGGWDGVGCDRCKENGHESPHPSRHPEGVHGPV